MELRRVTPFGYASCPLPSPAVLFDGQEGERCQWGTSTRSRSRTTSASIWRPTGGWYAEGDAAGYDRATALFTADLIDWVKQADPTAWKTLEKDHGKQVAATLVARVRQQLDARGTVDVLRHGVDVLGLKGKLELAQFRPALATDALLKRYDLNRLRVVRQVHYSTANENSLDLVLFLNGIPVATAELKTDFTQHVDDAVDQYRFQRDPRPKGRAAEPLLAFPGGAVVHFAVSNTEVAMTTRLAGKETRFLPFNRGTADGGAGNPPNPDGHPTAYLWEQVWQRDSWLEILGRYVRSQRDGKKQEVTGVIFPRYHQLDAVRKLRAAVAERGPGGRYLIQHSAGSGKTNSIAWAAHHLADLHDAATNKKLFATVLVVSDRNVIDAQLQEAIFGFERTVGVVATITGEGGEESRFARAANRFTTRVINTYGRWLDYVLDRQILTLLVATATVVFTAFLYIVIPKGFFPVQDTGLIQGISNAAPSASYAAMARLQQQLADVVLKDTDVDSLTSFIGVDGSNTTLNAGRFLINLKPRDERSGTASDTIRRLQTEVAGLTGIQLFMQPVQDLSIDTTVSATQYQFVLENADITAFTSWIPKLLTKLKAIPDIIDVASDMQNNGLAADITIDRATAGRFGITPATVDNALYDAFGQRIVSTIFTQSNQYRVILDSNPSGPTGLQNLSAIYLPSSTATGGQVPLSSLVTVTTRSAPLVISHLGQFPSTTISFNLAPGASLGTAVNEINQAEKDLHLPDSFVTAYQGAAAAFQNSLGNELYLVLAAIATMYIVLGVLYESFIHPITILSTLPSAGVGALLALMIVGSDLDIIGIIGIVLLIGIVKKNAIMMIDFALVAEREHGRAPRDAIHEASMLRLRPILMTTMAALFSALPLMLGTGTGSELRRPLGIAIFGGLIVSQVLTLFTTPVIYLLFDRIGQRFSPKASKEVLS